MRRKYRALEEEYEALKSRDPFTQVKKKEANQNEVELRNQFEKKLNECNQLNNAVMMKEKKILELEKKLKNQQSDYQDRMKAQQDDITFLNEKIAALKEELRQAQQAPATQSKRRTIILNQQRDEYRASHLGQIEENDNASHDEEQILRMPTVTKDDVEVIGKKMRYQFKNCRMSLAELDKFLFGEDIQDNEYVTISFLKHNLELTPFLLEDEEALLVARYLVEENTDPYVFYRSEAEAPVPRIRSIFKNLVGNYSILPEFQEKQFWHEIAHQLTKNHFAILDSVIKLKAIHHNPLPENTLTVEDFKEAIADQNFSSKQIDYILQYNYKVDQSLTLVQLDQLFQLFKF